MESFYKGFFKMQVPQRFLSSSFIPDLIRHSLQSLSKKVKDCGTTTGHIEPVARTLMKDARRGLIHKSGCATSPGAYQALPARVQPASHQRVQCTGDS